MKYLDVLIILICVHSSDESDVFSENFHGISPTNYSGLFWQLTDIHWDLEYDEEGDKTKMCHQSPDTPANKSLGHYGNYLCDAPYPLIHSAFRAMKNIEPHPDFILWTGDNAPHTDDLNFSVIFKTIKNLTEEITSLFGPTVPLIPVLGNHDAYPKDDYPPSGESFYSRYLTEGSWDSHLSPEAQITFKKGGYYRVCLDWDVDILVLNTNLYYKYNELGEGLKDPGGQFQWMKNCLQDAKLKKRKVVIAAHAPPGYWERNPTVPFFNDTYNDAYVDILNDFGEVILSQIYGHEHTDSFRIFGINHEDLRSVAFLAPSLTPWFPSRLPGGTAINPSLRLYLYTSTEITDYVQYHLNLTEANNSSRSGWCLPFSSSVNEMECEEASKVSWKKYYRATEAYGVSSLGVNELENLYGRLLTNESLFQEYYKRNSAGVDDGYCNETCKRGHICAMSHLKVKSLLYCTDLTKSSKYPLPTAASHLTNDNSFHTLPTEENFKDDFASHLAVAIVVGGVFLTIILGVMIVVIGGRQKKILNSVSNTFKFGWANHQNGYRPLSSMEAN